MSTNQPPPYPGDSTPPAAGGYPPPGGGYPPPGGYAPAPGGYSGPPRGNQKALWSMITGITSLVIGVFCGFFIIGSIVAIVLGFVSRGEIKRSQGTQTGAGQALTGIITGFVFLAIFALAVVAVLTGVVELPDNFGQ